MEEEKKETLNEVQETANQEVATENVEQNEKPLDTEGPNPAMDPRVKEMMEKADALYNKFAKACEEDKAEPPTVLQAATQLVLVAIRNISNHFVAQDMRIQVIDNILNTMRGANFVALQKSHEECECPDCACKKDEAPTEEESNDVADSQEAPAE